MKSSLTVQAELPKPHKHNVPCFMVRPVYECSAFNTTCLARCREFHEKLSVHDSQKLVVWNAAPSPKLALPVGSQMRIIEQV